MTAVLLVDDHSMFREGLVLTIAQTAPHLVIYPAASGQEALATLARHPEIARIIMDYYLPDVGGSALVKHFRQLRPGIRILVLSASEDPEDERNAIEAGAHGYLHKSANSQRLVTALDDIGNAPSGAACSEKNGAPAKTQEKDDAALLRELTPRQLEVLRLICDGLPNKEISERLSMSEKTVKSHVSSILATLGVLNRTQATLVARRGGLYGRPS